MARTGRCAGYAVLGILGLGAGAPLAAQDAMFRVEDMDLRDPHVFVEFIGCFDFTDNDSFGASFNQSLQQEIQEDGDADGRLDLSYVLEFLPLAQDQASTLLDQGETDCSAPLAGTACRSREPWPTASLASNLSAGTCLAPIAGTLTDSYTPEVTSTAAPCFVASPGTVVIDVGGIPLNLRDVSVAAGYDAAPAQRLVNGLLRGFLSEADADATLLPADYPVVGGQPLSILLPGGQGNCAGHDGRDLRDGDGESGWYFYFNFTAPQVTSLPNLVFADGFEPMPPPAASGR